jgi:hypothetical protein
MQEVEIRSDSTILKRCVFALISDQAHCHIAQTAEKLINELVGDRSFDAGGKREVQLESSSSDRKVIKMENLGRFDIVKSRLY